MIRRIEAVEALADLTLRVRFDDGKVVLYDVGEDVRDIPSYSPLATMTGLFQQVRLDSSRTCVFWNDEIDLPSDAIYDYGKELVPAHQAEAALRGSS